MATNEPLPDKFVQRFAAHKPSGFFWLQEGQHRKVAFKYPESEDHNEYDSPQLWATEPLPVSFIRIGKIVGRSQELGFFVDVPNLSCFMGRNYLIVRRRDVLPGSVAPKPILRINRFTVLEVPNQALSIVCDNTGNSQV